MRSRSSRRAARLCAAALIASVAPMALAPAFADDAPGLRFDTSAWEASPPDATRGLGLFQKRVPYSNPDVVPYFDGGVHPLEVHPTRLGFFDTANMLPDGAFMPYLGTIQTEPGGSAGTGNQVYFFGGRAAITDGLTLGLDFFNYDDFTRRTIGGVTPQIIMEPLEVSGRLRVFDTGVLAGTAQVALGSFTNLNSSVFGGQSQFGDNLIASAKMPLTYDHSPKLQFHVTPGVSIFPETVNGADFYGTLYTLGGGVSYKPGDRTALYATLDLSFGSGGNTIASDGSYENVPVWTVGGRYNVTPKVALDFYATNGVGTTPTTSILTHFPSGSDVLLGATLSWTPGVSYRDSYRGRPEPLSLRQLRLQQDGLILSTGEVIDPGMVFLSAWQGTDSHYGVQFSFGLDRDFQADFIFEDFAAGTVDPAALRPEDELRYMVGPKLRFLDQNQGDPFSASARLLFGRQFDSAPPYVGVFYLEGTGSYSPFPTLAVNGAVKVAAFGTTEVLALGVGANYELFEGLQVIGEVHLVGGDASTPTWGAGVRYSPPGSTASVDATLSNAIGRHGIGTIIAQDDVQVTVGVSTRFSVR